VSEILTFPPAQVMPARDAVLAAQGVMAGNAVPEHIADLHDTAIQRLEETVAPIAMLCEVARTDFADVYRGEERNEPRTPVGDMFGRADHLALFAVTLGEPVSQAIADCFGSHDFALGAMLDAAASEAADKAADLVERRFGETLHGRGWTMPPGAVLRYSPGYCGWHVSGQRQLFDRVRPEQIGLSLTESYLMQPLKSVSGVIIGAARDIHKFAASYSFCSQCETRGCRERIRALFRE
jgi:hypothetical protein